MASVDPRMKDLVWTDRYEYEALLHKRPASTHAQTTTAATTVKPISKVEPAAAKKTQSSVCADGKALLAELEAARGFIRASLGPVNTTTTQQSLLDRASHLETSNNSLKKIVEDLTAQIERLESKISNTTATPVATSKPAAKAAKKEESDSDDFNFSDSEDEDDAPKESGMERMKRLAAEKKAEEAAKEAAKPHSGPITKSNVLIDVKPWSDETDLVAMEKAIRAIEMEGLKWGDSKHVEIGFGIKKIRIGNCIVDHLVGLYELEEKLIDLEEFVQSVDIVSHNKI